MYCPHCGKKIPKGSVFCPYCRHRLSNLNLHNVEKKLKPKTASLNTNDNHDYNLKHISKKAKVLFGCIIAAAIIGGGVHHYHYEKTPASVNLSKQMNGNRYKMSSLIEATSDFGNSDSDNNNHMSTSDKRNINHIIGKFNSDGNIQLSYKGHTVPASSDNLGYSTQGGNLSLNMSDNSDSSDNQYLNLNLKLIHTNESHKDLTFKITHDSDKVNNTPSDQNQQDLNNLINRKITFRQD